MLLDVAAVPVAFVEVVVLEWALVAEEPVEVTEVDRVVATEEADPDTCEAVFGAAEEVTVELTGPANAVVANKLDAKLREPPLSRSGCCWQAVLPV